MLSRSFGNHKSKQHVANLMVHLGNERLWGGQGQGEWWFDKEILARAKQPYDEAPPSVPIQDNAGKTEVYTTASERSAGAPPNNTAFLETRIRLNSSPCRPVRLNLSRRCVNLPAPARPRRPTCLARPTAPHHLM